MPSIASHPLIENSLLTTIAFWLAAIWGTKLCQVIIDRADQAKLRALKVTRLPKAMEGEYRPRIKCVGTLVHGHECSFTMVEANIEKGSNLTLEVLTRALDRVLPATGGNGFPTHFWMQCDNAGGENKNQWVLRWLALLVDRGVFRSCVFSTLQVGHTHEDLDGLLGIMSMEIASALDWDHPMQMAEIVQRRMAGHLKPLPVMSGLLDAVRDWKAWLTPLDDIDPKTGISGLMTSNTHWLCFARRTDLPVELALASTPALGGDGSLPGDVVCMAKEYMSSPALMQNVFTVCRAGRSSLLPEAPTSWTSRKPFTRQEHDDAARLAAKVQQYLPERIAAVRYIEQWMAQPATPSGAPTVPAILQHRWHHQQHSDAIGPVLERAVLEGATGEPRLLAIKRRKSTLRGIDLPLAAYVAFREAQGISTAHAVEEWNGAQIVNRSVSWVWPSVLICASPWRQRKFASSVSFHSVPTRTPPR
jgi:hypothetical protein